MKKWYWNSLIILHKVYIVDELFLRKMNMSATYVCNLVRYISNNSNSIFVFIVSYSIF